MEYGSQIWSGGLTQMQKRNIEIIQKRALRIISEHRDNELLLAKSNLLSLKRGRNNLGASLIEDMLEPEVGIVLMLKTML